ncbi:hypothetical protein BC567DRAFT_45375 [Phyllosticta citribraziliensis]
MGYNVATAAWLVPVPAFLACCAPAQLQSALRRRAVLQKHHKHHDTTAQLGHFACYPVPTSACPCSLACLFPFRSRPRATLTTPSLYRLPRPWQPVPVNRDPKEWEHARRRTQYAGRLGNDAGVV